MIISIFLGVDVEFQHDKDPTVFQIIFVTNTGTLLTACTDNTVYLWDFKRKKPEIVQSLKLSKERLTVICCEFQDKWLYIGKKIIPQKHRTSLHTTL